MDGILSFHIGLVARVMARDAVRAPDRPAPRLEKTRRQWEQAAEAQVAADEAEEFEAVGVRCRETLISFVHAMGTPELLPEGVAPPKASDFIHWSEHIANAVAPGSSDARLRSYIKAQARQTWDYVSWLTHAKNASRADGEIAVQIVAHFLQILEEAIDRAERGVPSAAHPAARTESSATGSLTSTPTRSSGAGCARPAVGARTTSQSPWDLCHHFPPSRGTACLPPSYRFSAA
jgi:hypothetical protein